MKRTSLFLVALGAAVAVISPVRATTTFNAASGDYGTPSNWNNGVPDSGNTGHIGNDSVAQVSTAISQVAGVLTIGELDHAGTLTVIGPGSITVGQMELGKNLGAGSSGTLNLLGGSVTTNSLLAIGFDQDNPRLAEGFFNISSGTLTAKAFGIYVGGTSKGTMTQTGGTVQTVASGIEIGLQAGASGSTLNLSGGTLTSATFLNVGNSSNPSGRTLNVSGTAVLHWGTDGGSSDLLTVFADMVVSGKLATISSANTAAGAFGVRSAGNLRFNLASDGGASMIDIAGAKIAIETGADLIIDGAALALSTPGDYFFTLIDHNGYLSAPSMNTTFLSFGSSYTPSVAYNAGEIKLKITVVPEPNSWALLGVAALLLTALIRRGGWSACAMAS